MPSEEQGKDSDEVPKTTFGEGNGSPSRAGSDVESRGRRILRFGPLAEAERAPWPVASGDSTLPPTACPFLPTRLAAAQGEAGHSSTGALAPASRHGGLSG